MKPKLPKDPAELRRMLKLHPMRYGIRPDGGTVYDPTEADAMRCGADLYRRCLNCEQWSPCDVRKRIEAVLDVKGEGAVGKAAFVCIVHLRNDQERAYYLEDLREDLPIDEVVAYCKRMFSPKPSTGDGAYLDWPSADWPVLKEAWKVRVLKVGDWRTIDPVVLVSKITCDEQARAEAVREAKRRLELERLRREFEGSPTPTKEVLAAMDELRKKEGKA